MLGTPNSKRQGEGSVTPAPALGEGGQGPFALPRAYRVRGPPLRTVSLSTVSVTCGDYGLRILNRKLQKSQHSQMKRAVLRSLVISSRWLRASRDWTRIIPLPGARTAHALVPSAASAPVSHLAVSPVTSVLSSASI